MINMIGTNIKANKMLKGQRDAYMIDGVIQVSPAMYTLITKSTGEELDHVLKKIYVVEENQFSQEER